MLSSHVLAAIIMATVAYTATCPHRLAHLADFRVFGSPGCYDKNLGIWTVVEGDVGPDECNGLNGDDVRSLSVVDINKGCICKPSLPTLSGLSGMCQDKTL